MSDKRTAEEWGRVAVSLPGWRWMPGMLQWRTGPWMGSRRSVDSDYCDTGHEARVMGGDTWPDPDDPATEGCLLRLLGDRALLLDLPTAKTAPGLWRAFVSRQSPCFTERLPLGRACIAAAEALGRWPGGAS
jgi:hypothetical protein